MDYKEKAILRVVAVNLDAKCFIADKRVMGFAKGRNFVLQKKNTRINLLLWFIYIYMYIYSFEYTFFLTSSKFFIAEGFRVCLVL
jgi:hypothetical protein